MQGIYALKGFELRMMDILVSSPSYIFGDNVSVGCNIFKSESVLRKKSNSVCYHSVHESVAMGEAPVGNIPSKKYHRFNVLYG